MHADSIRQLVACLESFRERPAMYLGKIDVECADQWLSGFELAVNVLLGRDDLNVRQRALTSRGWSWSARRPSAEMVERGLSPAAVIDELLLIECEVLRQRIVA
ncbi:MAG: hypothetical protein JWM11_1456 [Planctomycetaceae bacterium]|nr:hypothetical protein [Planctomycetaceae bacterium]